MLFLCKLADDTVFQQAGTYGKIQYTPSSNVAIMVSYVYVCPIVYTCT